MGNYKKTVRCSYCNRLGHNRITCPELESDIQTIRSLYGRSHPKVLEYDLKRKNYSKKSSNNANKKRYCSYCFEAGHNRRTCAHLKDHKSVVLDKNYLWRKSVVKMLKRQGINIGTLISHNTEYVRSASYNLWVTPSHGLGISSKDLWMIVKINWDDINFFESCDEIFTISLMKRPSTKMTISLESLIYNETDLYKSDECAWKVISKTDSVKVPKNWLSGDDKIVTKVDTFFNDMTNDAYKEAFLLELNDRNHLINNVLKEAKQNDRQKDKPDTI